METDEEGSRRALPFQLQFDKPLASQVKMAEWNPEKDLLAMVTEDSKVVLHRFNWQRLWTISPGKCITSLCWRPDGKVVVLGLEDGTVSLHDVENGKLLRSLKSHAAAVVCLNWEEDAQVNRDTSGNTLAFEDRTTCFFPPAPRVPRMPGLVPGDTGLTDDGQDSFVELSNSSKQCFNILCSGDKDGVLCFSKFGVFPIGNVNIHECNIPTTTNDRNTVCRLLNASISKVALSKDLCCLTVACSGELVEDIVESRGGQKVGDSMHGFHCLVLDTSIFQNRKNELHQVAQQASNIEDLLHVIRTSLSVMHKQWADAMNIFHEKFDLLSNLISDHGLDSSPQEELLSLLGGARTSPAVHQFLVNSLGEVVMKRVSKVVCGAGKELQLVVLNHLQPAVEIIGFRMGELRGLSRWRSRYLGIRLDETLVNNAVERAGMLLVQVERFIRVLSSVVQQFANFFSWLLKCIKQLMSEPSDQLLTYNSELVVVFLKFLYDQDPVMQLLDLSDADEGIDIDLETMQRVRELLQFGGFGDTEYLRRTLAKEFQQMEHSFKEAAQMPFSTISKKILCTNLLPLFPLTSVSTSTRYIPISLSFYEDDSEFASSNQTHEIGFTDYISFQIPDESFVDVTNCLAVVRGLSNDSTNVKQGRPLEAILLCIPPAYCCVDLALYKEHQIVMLLNKMNDTRENLGDAWMTILQACDLPFVHIAGTTCANNWELYQLKDSILHLDMENEKIRSIPHAVVPPLSVSASRGVACVLAARKRALVYILDEDEDEISDSE
ncbi:anaphase-promoting complex subunit 4-like isoform X1 [Syzygium oleosum]|uniref:anaphase-promoting complex subunit 4-like isoform X1 n=1 Tax=Syzygium oleosum TaxID=219896 RepID=UPI0024B93F7C|nr:anaphase-promoting complex subunit 4-like isoform X1 [Syzygium oleosum]